MTSNGVVNTENNSINYREGFNYRPAGNICTVYPSAEAYGYDTQNKLTSFRDTSFTYDADGNMLTSTLGEFAFDSSNRLISTQTNSGSVTYTYDAEGTRIKSECGEDVIAYTYDVNARLSKLLVKTEGDVTTKYVYGLGLIGEETNGEFKTYHFDLRGSTVAITDENCNVTDTFEYDTYGKLVTRTGTSKTPFMYNGRDGVITEDNGLYYMRARYYSPVIKRFINADIVAGSIANAVTLNRYAYANCNPVSNVDPLGLSAERGSGYRTSTIYVDEPTEAGYAMFDDVEYAIPPEDWYNSADEAAYAFGLQYSEVSYRVDKVEYGATIYSKVAYEYNGYKYNIMGILDLYKKGEITSMSEFFKTTKKSRIYTFGSVRVGEKDHVTPSLMNKLGKIEAVVHTHGRVNGNSGYNQFSGNYYPDLGVYEGDLGYAGAIYEYGVKYVDAVVNNSIDRNTLSKDRGIENFSVYLITGDGEIKKYTPSIHRYMSGYDRDISSEIPHKEELYKKYGR